MVKLFSPFQVKNITLKNRIVMSPMCMYSAKEDGFATDWHVMHYASRAIGQVGLIVLESTSVTEDGRISMNDLGIWDDAHIEGLRKITRSVKKFGAHVAIQISHAGRKAVTDKPNVGPSAITYSEKYPVPHELTIQEIQDIVKAFQHAARRSKEAEFDVIELHGAHGYLIHQFLSPLSNKRQDEYGGSIENRYKFLKEVVEAVKKEWDGPLFVRLSLEEYNENGNTKEDYRYVIQQLKAQGVDLIDCSSGAIVPAHIEVYPGYQVPLADWVKNECGINTGAVGLITSGLQAEEILQNNRADLIFIGRELLRNPYWPLKAAEELKTWINAPFQYLYGWREVMTKNENRDIWAPGKDVGRKSG